MSNRPARACGVCGADAPSAYRPPAAETAPDLDFRPGEPARSTLGRWIAQCGACGAAAADLAALTETREQVRQLAGWQPPGPAAGRAHWRAAALAEAGGRADDAFAAFLGAAWAADDAGDADTARLARERALAARPTPQGGQDALQALDVMRRAGLFDAARALADRLAAAAPDPATAAMLGFQQARIAERDAARHLISSALRPPARTPHVLHGREASRTFLGRLFGR